MHSGLAVIGGSGLYQLDGLSGLKEHRLDTPFGSPSDAIIEGWLGQTRLLFLPRHGRNHQHPPHTINARANICALKLLGADQILSVSAVGSMRETLHPGDVVVVDQYVDWTKRRISTFFDEEITAHVAFADPVCPNLSSAAADAALRAGGRVTRGGTYLCIDGPQFSTRAESTLFRSLGIDVIGMTALPEAKLAREAELPYATLAFVTDYDCWHETEETVSVEAVLLTLKKNTELAKSIVTSMAADLPDPSRSPAARALAGAIISDLSKSSSRVREKLDFILKPYVEKKAND